MNNLLKTVKWLICGFCVGFVAAKIVDVSFEQDEEEEIDSDE